MRRILIVDDEPSITESFKEAFEYEQDYKIVSANNGEDAIKLIQSMPLDLIILDWRLKSRIEGRDILILLKRDYANIPVYILTASYQALAEVKALGANGYFLKPCAHLKDKIISLFSMTTLKLDTA